MDTHQPVNWSKELPASITVCDTRGVILEMNNRAAKMYQEMGGWNLLGSNALDCHPEQARRKFQDLLISGKDNAYTIEKNGVRKLVYQAPWHTDGEYRGLVEIVIPLPENMRHFVRH
jgi:transcriptional regulator with PAS, ATPase and Fis domain